MALGCAFIRLHSLRHADEEAVDTQSARQLTAFTGVQLESEPMLDGQSRTLLRKFPSVEDAAADIRRLTAALEARRQVAPDNLVELAALAVDLQRASAVWRRLVPSGFWS